MIVLGSASPRRRELLAAAGLAFEIEAVALDETIEDPADPVRSALLLAERKACAVALRRAARGAAGPEWVIGADTVVALGEPGPARILGKPAGAAEAAGMLLSLSGTRHRVVTGVCVVRSPDGALEREAETTWVTMRPIEAGEVEAYVASGEWHDKAGGYAIQETGDAFVSGLEGGGFDNVVGLPVSLTLALLRRSGAPV